MGDRAPPNENARFLIREWKCNFQNIRIYAASNIWILIHLTRSEPLTSRIALRNRILMRSVDVSDFQFRVARRWQQTDGTSHHKSKPNNLSIDVCARSGSLFGVRLVFSSRKIKDKTLFVFCVWQRIATRSAVAFVSAVRSLLSRLDYCTWCSTIR